LLSYETRLNCGGQNDGYIDEGGIETGVERGAHVALSIEPGQQQVEVDDSVVLVCLAVLGDRCY